MHSVRHGGSTTFETKSSYRRVARQGLPCYTAPLGIKRRATTLLKSNLIRSIEFGKAVAWRLKRAKVFQKQTVFVFTESWSRDRLMQGLLNRGKRHNNYDLLTVEIISAVGAKVCTFIPSKCLRGRLVCTLSETFLFVPWEFCRVYHFKIFHFQRFRTSNISISEDLLRDKRWSSHSTS